MLKTKFKIINNEYKNNQTCINQLNLKISKESLISMTKDKQKQKIFISYSTNDLLEFQIEKMAELLENQELIGLSPENLGKLMDQACKDANISFQGFNKSKFSNSKQRRFFPDQPGLSRCLTWLAKENLAEIFWNSVLYSHLLLLRELSIIRSEVTLIADYTSEPCRKNKEDLYCFGTKEGKTVHKTLIFSIMLACNSSNLEEIGGCIYVVPESTHLSFGKPIPIFGWLQTDNPETTAFLLKAAENIVKEQGHHALRGPINEPHLYGGWGAVIEKDPSFPVMVDAPQNPLELGPSIEASGYTISATYLGLDTKTVHYPSILFRNNQFRFISPTWDEFVVNPNLLEKVKAHVKRNFAYYLPDHNSGTFEKTFHIFSQVKNGNDFYLFMQDTKTDDIVGLIWFVPNVSFNSWDSI
jgi:hypothetical protein